MKIGSVFEQTSTTEFVAMLDQQYDNERLLFSYVELSPNGGHPDVKGERIIARIKNLCKENPLLSRDQAGISASVDIGGLGFDFSRRFTYGWAECSVIGALINGRLDMNRRVIAPNAEVHTPLPETLRDLFFKNLPEYIPLGEIDTFGQNCGVPVTLNADQLVTKHFCIFGMTGSGKTNTSAKLLEELLARGHRMVIFDSHDDYQNLENFKNLFYTDSESNPLKCRVENRNCHAVQLAIQKLSPLEPTRPNGDPLVPDKPLNHWVCERLIRTTSVISENVPSRRIISEHCDRVTEQLVENIAYSQPWGNFLKYSLVESLTIFPEIKFYGDSFKDFLINLMEAFLGEDFSDPQRSWLNTKLDKTEIGLTYIDRLLDAAKTHPREDVKAALSRKFNALKSIYTDASKSGAVPTDLQELFNKLACRESANPKSVYRLSLSNLSGNLRKALVYGVVTYCFRSFKFGNFRATSRKGDPPNAYPILFILEEARSLIPRSSSDDIDIAGRFARRAMREIAYEGRKFSLGFGLISQKPSTVDPEVVSQSNTFILHQLKSPDDQEYVRSVTESMSKDELEMIKSLGTGRAIVAGVAIQSPVLLKVYPRYSEEGIQEPTPIADSLATVQQIREQLNINDTDDG